MRIDRQHQNQSEHKTWNEYFVVVYDFLAQRDYDMAHLFVDLCLHANADNQESNSETAEDIQRFSKYSQMRVCYDVLWDQIHQETKLDIEASNHVEIEDRSISNACCREETVKMVVVAHELMNALPSSILFASKNYLL